MALPPRRTLPDPYSWTLPFVLDQEQRCPLRGRELLRAGLAAEVVADAERVAFPLTWPRFRSPVTCLAGEEHGRLRAVGCGHDEEAGTGGAGLVDRDDGARL